MPTCWFLWARGKHHSALFAGHDGAADAEHGEMSCSGGQAAPARILSSAPCARRFFAFIAARDPARTQHCPWLASCCCIPSRLSFGESCATPAWTRTPSPPSDRCQTEAIHPTPCTGVKPGVAHETHPDQSYMAIRPRTSLSKNKSRIADLIVVGKHGESVWKICCWAVSPGTFWAESQSDVLVSV